MDYFSIKVEIRQYLQDATFDKIDDYINSKGIETNIHLKIWKAEIEFFRGNVDTSIKIINRVRELQDDTLVFCLASIIYAKILRRKAEIDNAIVILDEISDKIYEMDNFNLDQENYYDLLIYYLNIRGLLFSYIGEYKIAENIYNEFIEVSLKTQNKIGYSQALHNLGAIYARLGDAKKGLKTFEQSYQINIEKKDTWRIALSLENISNMLIELGKYDEALDKLNKAKKIWLEAENYHNLAACNSRISSIFFQRGDLKNSLTHCDMGLKHISKEDSPYIFGRLITRKGLIIFNFGYHEEADKLFDTAFEIYQNIENKYDEFAILIAIAKSSFRRGKYNIVEEIFNSLIELRHDQNDYTRYLSDNDVAVLYWMRGEIDKAINILEESLEYVKKINNPFMISTIAKNLAKTYFSKDDLTSSTNHYQLVYDIALSIDNPIYLAETICEIIVNFNETENFDFRDLMSKLVSIYQNNTYPIIEYYYLISKIFVSYKTDDGDLYQSIHQFLNEEVLDDYLYTKVLNLHLKLLLLDFSQNLSQDILYEINSNIETQILYSKHQGAILYLVELYIFKIKLAEIMFDYQKVAETSDEIKQLLKENKLAILLNKIQSVENEVTLRKDEWMDLVTEKPSQKNELIKSRVRDVDNYIKGIKGVKPSFIN